MGGIFISYRRSDSAYIAGRLHDRLVTEFGADSIFRDVDTMRPGVDFVQRIDDAVASCDALVAIIGDQWLTMTGEDGRPRLSDPKDWVRLEIGAALKRRILVLPVLVENARMPSEAELPAPLRRLARLNAMELSDKRWDYEANQLTSVLRDVLAPRAPKPTRRPSAPPTPLLARTAATEGQAVVAPPPPVAPHEPEAGPRRPRWARPGAVAAAVVAAALLVGGLLVLVSRGGTPDEQAVLAGTSSSLPEPATTVPPAAEAAPPSADPAVPGEAPSVRTGGRATPDPGPVRSGSPTPTSPPVTSPPTPTPTTPPPAIVVPPRDPAAGQLSITPQSGPPGTVINLSAGGCGRPAGWTDGVIYTGLSSDPGGDAVKSERPWPGDVPWKSQLTVPAVSPGEYWAWANCYAWDPGASEWKMFYLYPSLAFQVT